MDFSPFQTYSASTRLIFSPAHSLAGLSWLGMCQTYRLTDYTVLNLTCLWEKLFLSFTRAHTHTDAKLQKVLKGGNLIADRMLSPENTC